jgi:hypothetical protein
MENIQGKKTQKTAPVLNFTDFLVIAP